MLALTPVASAHAQTEAPGFIYAQALRGHMVVVNWEPPLDTTVDITYRIYRAEGPTIQPFPDAAWTLVGTTNGRLQTSYLDDEPKANSARYWYVVTAQKQGQPESLASPVNSAAQGWTTGNRQSYYYVPTNQPDSYQRYIGPVTQPPLEPTNLRISGVDEEITIEWDPVPSTNIIAYRIYRFTASGQDPEGVDPVGIVTGGPPATSFTDYAVERYRHYWYRVEAVDSQGNPGFRSIEVHFRTVGSEGPSAPHAPSENPQQGNTCQECHQLHVAPGPKLLKFYPEGVSEAELCMTCHDGTGSRYNVRREFTDDPVSGHLVTVGEMQGDFACVDCHTPHGTTGQTPKLLSVDGETGGIEICFGSGCHGPVDTWMPDDLPPRDPGNEFTPAEFDFQAAFGGSAHAGIPDPESGTGIKCSTCHQPHASPNRWLWTSDSYRGCFQCHGPESIDLTSPDIYTRMTLSSDSDTSHNVLARNQGDGSFMACQHCHNTHAVTVQKPLVDPWNPGIHADYQWGQDRYAPLAVPDGSPAEPRHNEFCIACHGTRGLPQAGDTLPWVDPPKDAGSLTKNIETDWTARVHGRDSKGGAVLDPAMGYANGQTLSCMACHEPHGTANNYNLRSDVPDINGNFPKHDLLLVPVLDAAGNPVEGAFDTRFFCSSCHMRTSASPPQHNSDSESQPKTYRYFPNNCSDRACHAHGTTGGKRF